MEGQTVSHYRVLERLGGGGMGVVYKALDTRLDRIVALKFLPAALTRDDDARARLILEAKAASTLDHPNICTVHDVDSTSEGQLFIVMAFYDGESLKKRLTRGPVPIAEAVEFAMQIARGLAKAHDAGIVHRDIKPANVMITTDGVPKIVDFGIAKLVDVTGSTQTGMTLGTAAYMAPEQLKGETVDRRADIWALGVVLYEMLAGRAPFGGDHALALLQNIAHEPPAPLETIRPDAPERLVAAINRALRKDRAARYESAGALAGELTDILATLRAPAAPAVQPAWRLFTRPIAAVAAVVVVATVATVVGWSVYRNNRTRWAREEALPEIRRLVDQDNYVAAFALAEQIEPYVANDPALVELWPRMSRTVSIVTKPEGARILTKAYGEDADAPWRDLGESPLEGVRLPVGLRRWRFMKEGLDHLELARPTEATLTVSWPATTAPGMVHVSGGFVNSWITGIEPITPVPVLDFLIDKFEVTNREFKAFVTAGGYRQRDYWEHRFIDQEKEVPWDEASTRFVDATGRPGPATWELGSYGQGKDDYPVTGVSWYEAAAYAKFVGKSLPTVTHWIRAAGTDNASAMAPLSNLQGSGLTAVGARQGMGPFGTYDMAGNVREWVWNEWAGSRYILGAAWSDPQYMFTYANVQSPFDRSPVNGIRLARYAGSGETPQAVAGPVELLVRDYTRETPPAQAAFEIYKTQFAYDPAPLDASAEPVTSWIEGIRVERASFISANGRDQSVAYIFLPVGMPPPYQTVLFFPGSSAIFTGAFSEMVGAGNDFVIRSGRALVIPVYRGTFDRRDGLRSTWPDESRRYVEYVESWVREAMRAIDYVETRGDLNATRLAFLGWSWGARMGAIIPAIEPRIKASVLLSGGLASGKARPEVDQLTYVSRVTSPVLMLNGQYDAIEPVETAQRPMFEMLGTPQDRKKWVVYDDGHSLAVRWNEVVKEALNWLDRHLGPVN